MQVLFRHAQEGDMERIREIGLKGLPVHYNNFPKEAILKIANEYHSEDAIRKHILLDEEEKNFFIVAEFNGKVIGFSNSAALGKKCELLSLYVDLGFNGKGIGSKFLEKGIIFAKKRGCKKYVAFINNRNRDLVHFFLKNGFRHFDNKDREREFKDGKMLWCMEKSVQ